MVNWICIIYIYIVYNKKIIDDMDCRIYLDIIMVNNFKKIVIYSKVFY